MAGSAVGMTEADFERLSWHDCHLWGFELHRGEPDEDDWTSDVVFHLDYITEWLCGTDKRVSFRVAPARLTFHGVTDLKMAIDWGSSGFQVVPNQVIVNRISRELVADQKVYPDRSYYHWVVELHQTLTKGSIDFGAVGFTQTLLAEPVHQQGQSLTLSQRNRMLGR